MDSAQEYSFELGDFYIRRGALFFEWADLFFSPPLQKNAALPKAERRQPVFVGLFFFVHPGLIQSPAQDFQQADHRDLTGELEHILDAQVGHIIVKV